METELCDWCGQRFPADDAVFDTLASPATGEGRLATACSQEHLLALAQRIHRPALPRRRRLTMRWHRRPRRRMTPPTGQVSG